MILEVLASFATIIGVSIQIAEKYAEEHPGPAGAQLGALKALAVTGKTWKQIHSKYHSVDRNAYKILSKLERSVDGRIETLTPDRITPRELQDAFEDLNWQNYLDGLERQLKPSIDSIAFAVEKSQGKSEKALTGLRSSGNYEIAESIQTILLSQENILRTHKEFVHFLKVISEAIGEGSFDQASVKFVLKNRALLQTKLPALIGDTDNALMAILDIYNSIIESE